MAVISAGNSTPDAARSWAMPTRPLWPVYPSLRPVAFAAAAYTLLPIWLDDNNDENRMVRWEWEGEMVFRNHQGR